MVERRDDEYTHIVVRNTPYYLTGPEQGSPPDGELQRGTKVRYLEVTVGSYLWVHTENGIQCYVDGKDLTPINVASETQESRLGEYRGVVIRDEGAFYFRNDDGAPQRLTRGRLGEWPPEAQEINLAPYYGRRLLVRGDWQHDWIYSAEILTATDERSPT
jgi:hypothetical protein